MAWLIEKAIYDDARPAWEAEKAAYDEAVKKQSAKIKSAQTKYENAVKKWENEELPAWEAQHEIERATVDRIAYSGKVPVNNVSGDVQAGAFVLAVKDGAKIAGNATMTPDPIEYMTHCVGRIHSIAEDGRPIVIVKMG